MYIGDFFIRLFFIIFSKKKIKNLPDDLSIIFSHNLGGGTGKYLKNQIKKIVNPCIMIANYPLLIDFYMITYNNKRYLYTLSRLKKILLTLKISEITLNSLVSFRKRPEILYLINKLKSKNKCKLVVLFHDFHPICPNYTLFCNNHNCTKYCSQKEILSYKESWIQTFELADELRTFSSSSKDILLGFIPEYSKKITVVPHPLEYLKNLTPVRYPYILPLKVGVVGSITSKIKGLEVIRKLSDNLDLYIFGDIFIKKNGIHKMGKYSSIEMLKELIEKNKITVIFFPSIWAETFSYVVSEIIALDLPIVGFAVGAQAEKIKNYEKGVICQDFDTKSIIYAIKKAYALYADKKY